MSCTLVRAKAIQQLGGDGNVASQGVHDQFAKEVDLIHIGVLQSFSTHVPVRSPQHAPQKGQLPSNAPHRVVTTGKRVAFTLYMGYHMIEQLNDSPPYFPTFHS